MIEQPKFFAIAGAPGSGKTTLRQRLIASGQIDGSYFIYSDDDILYQMPGYQQAARDDFYLARDTLIREVWKITDPALEEAMQMRRNILYDRTCSTDINFQTMQKAKALGYNVEMHALTVNSLLAHYRIARRERQWEKGELKEIHGVRPDPQEKTIADFSRIFFDYACGTEAATPLDRVTLWQSEAGGDIIAEYKEGELVKVYSELEFERFKSKAARANPNAEARRAAMSMYGR